MIISWLEHTRLGELIAKNAIMIGRRPAALAYGVALLLWVLVLLFPVFSQTFEFALQDTAHRVSSWFRAAHPDLVIAAIDTESLQATPSRWPWKRAEFGRLIRKIAAGKPSVILVDILFQQPDEGDEILEAAIREAGCVALISLAEENTTGAVLKIQRYSSLKRFRAVARFDGLVWSTIDADGTRRGFVTRDDRIDLESSVGQIARHLASTTAMPPLAPNWPSRCVTAFPGYRGGIPHFRVSELLRGSLSPDLLKDKVVLLGVTAAIVHDYHPTPLGIIPGIEILGANLDTLVQIRIAEVHDGPGWRTLFGIFGLLLGFWVVCGPESLGFLYSLLLAGAITGAGLGISVGIGSFMPWGIFLISWFFAACTWHFSKTFHDFMSIQMMQAEAEATEKVQAQFFPKKPWVSENGYSCKGLCIPCVEVGGDYFDYVPLADKHLVFLIGDVAGHGFAAAMITTMAKTMVLDLSLKNALTPAALLTSINAVIKALLKGKRLMTAICGSLDPASHLLSLSFAGHTPAYIVSPLGSVREIVHVVFPLGIKAVFPQKVTEISLEPGEILFMYTDGLIEAANWEDQMFGYERLTESLTRYCRVADPEELVKLVLQDVRTFCASNPFNDDVTLLVISRAATS